MYINQIGKKKWWQLLKITTSEFFEDDAIKLSASLSYYTVFSLPPLLMIIISLCGIFFGAEAVRGEVFGQINGLVGNDAASQIQETLKNVEFSGKNVFAAIIGAIVLLMGASGVFSEIQSSVNYIWGLKAKPRRGFIKYLKNRLMSFSMVGSVGFLLLVSLIVNTMMDILSKRLMIFFPQVTVYLFYLLNIALVFIIITFLFSLIFKTLPDGKVSWKDSFIGSAITAIFFLIGKFLIGAYLGNSNVASTYGAAASVIVILVWVYYSAIILYFGAEFTKVYARLQGHKIIPNSYSEEIEKSAVKR